MPSLLLHFALAAFIAAVLLAEEFDPRSLAVVFGVTALPDLDAVVGLVIAGTHRAALHTLLVPLALTVALAVDLRRDRSVIRGRYGGRGVRIAWVSILSLVLSGVFLDLAHTGVNLLYPVYDQFYRFDGTVLITTHQGFVRAPPGMLVAPTGVIGNVEWLTDVFPQLDILTADGTTSDTHHPSPLDPTMGTDGLGAERKIWIAGNGIRLVVILTAVAVVSLRFALDRRD